MTTTATANVDLCIRAQRELFGAGRLELADELIAPDCVDHGGESGPGGPGRQAGVASGREAVKGAVRWLRGAFPDLAYEIGMPSATATASRFAAPREVPTRASSSGTSRRAGALRSSRSTCSASATARSPSTGPLATM